MDPQEAATLLECQRCRRRVANPRESFRHILWGWTGETAEGSSPPALLLSPSTSVPLASLEGGSNEIIFKDWNEASFHNRPSRHRQVFTEGHG